MDRVEVRGLSIHAKHGCHAEERKTGGTFEVDLAVFGDFSSAGKTDRITDAVDYVALMDLIKAEMSTPRNLIESVAKSIAQATIDRFDQVESVEVTVKKLQPPVMHDLQFVSASTSLERGQN